MKPNRLRVATVGVAAVAIAALAVSPALGGPSLKKLVKKEVAKQISKATGPTGQQGVQGLQGAQGSQGVPGTNGTNGATSVITRSTGLNVNNGQTGEGTVECDPGEKATGGGFAQVTGNATTIQASTPVFDSAGTPTAWRFSVVNNSGSAVSYFIRVICASP
jgi:hypothetical protein